MNLFLRVTRRRGDGFHDLASLFHAIGFGDRMEFEGLGEGGTDSMTCNMPGVPTDETNLVIRALELFRAKTGCRERFRCHLEKAVPAGAGLGGGSGNAATTLWQVNEMCGRPATEHVVLSEPCLCIVTRGTAVKAGKPITLRQFWGEDFILSSASLRDSRPASALT